MLVALPLALLAVAAAALLVKWPVRWAQALIWILVLQNVVVIALWKVTGSDALGQDLLYAKEVFIAGAGAVAVVLALREAIAGRLPAVLWIAVAFGVVCVAWVPISYLRHEGLEQIARGLRSLVYPVLLLLVGAVAVSGMRAAVAVRATLWWSSVVLGATAVIERTFIPLRFWVDLGLDQYWVAVRGQSREMLNGALPWNFYLPLFGNTVRRAFGIMTDPLDLSYFLLLPLALAIAEMWRARMSGERMPRLAAAAALASALGITFSLSRLPIGVAGALIVVAPLIALGLGRRLWQPALGWAAVSAAAFVAILSISVATTPSVGGADIAARAPVNEGSSGAHVVSLLRATDVGPLIIGRGLGTAGYLSSKYAASGADIGYENPYLDAAGQVGVLGGLLLAALLVVSTLLLLFRAPAEAMAITLPTGVTLGMLAAGGFLSGQLEVITSLGPTWLFTGVALSLCVASRARQEAPAQARTEPEPSLRAPTPAQR
ncbi:MAG TPA: hypothetical protein VOB72_01075 [Candidatus Dormibacteraeota bacterium]|nr:hypothetical protein [Candidatus Dormibacteraeota bacterium]